MHNESHKIINPARLSETVGEITDLSDQELDEVIARSQAALTTWAATSPENRATRLRDAATSLEQQIPRLTTLFTRENGKPLREAERDLQRSIELTRLI